MLDELRNVFERAQQAPEAEQRMIAKLIEMELERARQDAALPVEIRESYAGAWADLPDDDETETLDRMRHEASPTPSLEEQLRWLDGE